MAEGGGGLMRQEMIRQVMSLIVEMYPGSSIG